MTTSWKQASFSVPTHLAVAVIVLSACSTGGDDDDDELAVPEERITALERKVAEL